MPSAARGRHRGERGGAAEIADGVADKAVALAARISPVAPVAPAARSARALAKAAAKRTEDHLPAHSFTSLPRDLATICLNQIPPADPALPGFRLVTTPTPIQRRALDLPGVSHRLGTA